MSTCTINTCWCFFTILVGRFEEKNTDREYAYHIKSGLLCIKGTRHKWKTGEKKKRTKNTKRESGRVTRCASCM